MPLQASAANFVPGGGSSGSTTAAAAATVAAESAATATQSAALDNSFSEFETAGYSNSDLRYADGAIDDDVIDDIEAEMAKEEHKSDMDDLVAGMNDATRISAAMPANNTYGNAAAASSTAAVGSAASAAAAASSTLPAHLVSGAAEFWFPESRFCDCCKGYKHACSCGGLCRCAGGGGGSSGVGGGATTGGRGGSGTSLAAAAGQRGTNAVAIGRGSNSGRGSGGSKAPCKFYQSGSCKFGDSCRFSHA